MKKYLFIILLFFPLLFIKIPSYVELNNLSIIDKITIKCDNNKYIITLREIIPIKNDNGIKYKYKYYKGNGTNINIIIKEIDNNTKRKLYYKTSKYKYINCRKKE